LFELQSKTMDKVNEDPAESVELKVDSGVPKGQSSTISGPDDVTGAPRKHTRSRCLCQRTNVAHCCIEKWTVSYSTNATTKRRDAALEVILVPEAFRMWFYYGWWIFITVAILVSVVWADIDYEDNVFVEYFNGLSICIFFDFPPFSYFGAMMWMPQIFSLVIYEILDQFRVFDAFHDGEITQRFYRLYTVCSVYESVSFISFIQTMATGPEEQWRVHSVPYLLMTYGLWTMAAKRFLYMRATGKLDVALSEGHRWPKFKRYAGWAYVGSMGIAMFLKTSILWPNFFGLKLWTIDGWEWTDAVLQYSVYCWFVLTLVCPIIIYWVITEDLDTVRFVINRH